MHKNFSEIFEELAANNVISEGLYKFMELDNYLSPLTSYPINGIHDILFSRPFHRIYEDVYLLEEKDLDLLAKRALIIYINFIYFISYFLKYNHASLKEIETSLKEFIFYWNASSQIFDRIFRILNAIYRKKGGSGKYHLSSDGINLRIKDLDKNGPAFSSIIGLCPFYRDYFPKFSEKSIYGEIQDPFRNPRPCECFGASISEEDLVSIENMLPIIKQKIR